MTIDVLKGKVWKFGDEINTDLMVPSHALGLPDSEIHRYCFSANRPGWVDQVKKGDIIVGGKNSANTKRLHEICKAMGRESYHIETAKEIKDKWLKDKTTIGIVSGASTPRWIVDDVVAILKRKGRLK